MSHCYVKQPNGKWALWSSIVDDFIIINAYKFELIINDVIDAVKDEIKSAKRHAKEVENGNGWTDYETCLRDIRRVHGRKKADEIAKLTKFKFFYGLIHK